jgi:carbamoyl-phosphate synthase large subunit
MLGVKREVDNRALDLDYVGVKVPMFSFSRLVGADPMLGVEMASTGEVGCLGRDVHEALLHGLLATGFRFPRRGVLLSLGPVADKYWFADEAKIIATDLALPIYATAGTAEALKTLGIESVLVEKTEGPRNSALALIEAGEVDLVINVPREFDELGRPDGYLIRRCAVDHGVPLFTDLQLARVVIDALRLKKPDDLRVAAWNDFLLEEPTVE